MVRFKADTLCHVSLCHVMRDTCKIDRKKRPDVHLEDRVRIECGSSAV